MEKYGVDEDEDLVHEAKKKCVCPKCGTPLVGEDPTVNVLKCPHCGTAPFETPDAESTD